MTIIEDLLHGQSCPINSPHPLSPPTCPPHSWSYELRQGRFGSYGVWTCAKCLIGADDAETFRQAVRECVDDR